MNVLNNLANAYILELFNHSWIFHSTRPRRFANSLVAAVLANLAYNNLETAPCPIVRSGPSSNLMNLLRVFERNSSCSFRINLMYSTRGTS
jgi:hypothetical protein